MPQMAAMCKVLAMHCLFFSFLSPTAESFGVSAQIGSGVVRGGPEVRFHNGSTRAPAGFDEVLRGFWEGGVLLGISPELLFLQFCKHEPPKVYRNQAKA